MFFNCKLWKGKIHTYNLRIKRLRQGNLDLAVCNGSIMRTCFKKKRRREEKKERERKKISLFLLIDY